MKQFVPRNKCIGNHKQFLRWVRKCSIPLLLSLNGPISAAAFQKQLAQSTRLHLTYSLGDLAVESAWIWILLWMVLEPTPSQTH